MGLHSGSVSFVRYRVLGLKKSYKLADLDQNLKTFQAKKLRLQGMQKEENYGWVRPLGVMEESDEELAPDWDIADCRFDDGFLLRFRVDKRRIPSALLKMVLQEKVRKKNLNRQKPVGTRERKQILEEIRMELMASCLPTIAFYDAYWEADSGQLFLFNIGKKPQQIFEELFHKTFCEPLGLSLVKQDPPLLGLGNDEWRDIDGLTNFVQTVATSVPATLAQNIH